MIPSLALFGISADRSFPPARIRAISRRGDAPEHDEFAATPQDGFWQGVIGAVRE